jgi:hypothetical protein
MHELQRARRLPVFIDEEQWSRAYEAAYAQVEALYCQGKIEIPHGKVNGTLRAVAVQIATAALRAAAQDDEGDLSEVPGVSVAQIANHTAKYPPVRPSER